MFILLIGILLSTACGRERTPSTPPPTATVAEATATQSVESVGSTPQPATLIDTELLDNPTLMASCDQSDGVAFACATPNDEPQLQVAIDGGSFARWSLRADAIATPLTGDETLLLQAHATGNLKPNLYLVEDGGRRIPVSLARYGLAAQDEGEDPQVIAIPLREIRDDERQWAVFDEINEIQIVFEWAEMQGTLTLASLQFASVWQEVIPASAEAQSLAATLTVPTGFTVNPIAEQLRAVTQLERIEDGTLWASTQNGRIWRYTDEDDDGHYEARTLYATGFDEVVGLLHDPIDGAIWIGGRGQLWWTLDSDGNGVADQRALRLDGLPWGRHQNNGLVWNPDPDPFTGEPGNQWVYFGLGSTEDLEVGGEWNAQVVRFPRDGEGEADLETVSRGNRNPYMVIWAPVPTDLDAPNDETAWQLFASENGPDFNDAPDEVNHIRWQHDYGFPAQFGAVDTTTGAIDGDPYSGPIYDVTPHASASGLAYVTNPAWPAAYRTLYVSLFGQVFSEEIVGHTVERVQLRVEETTTGFTYRGEPSTFIEGLDRPLPMTTSLAGDLIVGDYATGVVYQIEYIGE